MFNAAASHRGLNSTFTCQELYMIVKTAASLLFIKGLNASGDAHVSFLGA